MACSTAGFGRAASSVILRDPWSASGVAVDVNAVADIVEASEVVCSHYAA